MLAAPRTIVLVLMAFLLILSASAAEDKKADPKKDDPAKKATVKKADGKKDADKDKDKPTDKDKDKPAEKMLTVGTVAGKVMAVVEAKKSLRIELTVGKNKPQVEWQAIEDVKVRMLNPPPKFDDKGRIRRYTAKELKELKGEDKKTPGYPAEFSDLKQGQYVQVTLVKKKGTPIRRGKDAGADANGENNPQMSLIVIVAEPQN
jgi:hypothetical protein